MFAYVILIVGAAFPPGRRPYSLDCKALRLQANSPRNPQPVTRNAQPATRNPKPATRNPQPATRNPQPATRNS